MINCTVITYTNGEKEIRYNNNPVYTTHNVSHISSPRLTTEEIETIKGASTDKVQSLLSKFY